MCGIAGSLSWKKQDSMEHVCAITDALTHRGPDAGNVVDLTPAILGHRRLSVIDLDIHANQPLCDISKRYWIVFNGEIYNFKDLRQQLEQQGFSFSTQSDTEVLLTAYQAWGVDCLQHLVGMFAFAIWDTKAQTLFLARDRLGEKPLYYTPFDGNHLSSGIIWASEAQALAKHIRVNRSVNVQAIDQFVSLGYLLTDTCIYEHMHKLPPAHYLLLTKDTHIQHTSPAPVCYWQLADHFIHKSQYTNIAEAEEKLHALMMQAIEGQTISDVPLGAFLSGGIDSSTIAAAMARHNGPDRTHTYTIDFAEDGYSELAQSQTTASALGIAHHFQEVSGNMATLLPTIVKAADEPFADTSIIPTYFLTQYTRQHVTVALSGDGGDELFAGYETYLADRYHRIAHAIPAPILRMLASIASTCIPASHGKVSFDYKLKQFLHGAAHEFAYAHYFWRVLFDQRSKRSLLRQDSFPELTDPFTSFAPFYHEVAHCHRLDQASYVDIKTWLANDVLVKIDRMAMAHSLETRVPFLDHRIVEFAASLPPSWKLKGHKKKHILKESQKDHLPREVLYRKKRGFNAPVAHWLKGDLHELSRDILQSDRMRQWFDASMIDTLWQQHCNQQADHGFRLFALTCLGLWMEQQ